MCVWVSSGSVLVLNELLKVAATTQEYSAYPSNREKFQSAKCSARYAVTTFYTSTCKVLSARSTQSSYFTKRIGHEPKSLLHSRGFYSSNDFKHLVHTTAIRLINLRLDWSAPDGLMFIDPEDVPPDGLMANDALVHVVAVLSEESSSSIERSYRLQASPGEWITPHKTPVPLHWLIEMTPKSTQNLFQLWPFDCAHMIILDADEK